jgi:hypothetical protein
MRPRSRMLLDGFRSFAIPAFALGDFLAVYRYLPRRLHANAHLAAVHSHHRDFDVVADAESFTGASGQYEHGAHRKEVEQ